MIIPKRVNQIIKRLNTKGYKAYVVGGCVRDSLMGIEPDDWDITTSATPEQIKETLMGMKGCKIDSHGKGEQFGTVVANFEGVEYEITTYRCDGTYTDGRKPDSVSFCKNIVEDLARRDFTVNAMAYNHKEGVIDPYGGQEDLRLKVIRCVGNAEKRFEEDRLRVLRAVRFAVKYNFKIEESTLDAINKKKDSIIGKVSYERIQKELLQIVMYMSERNLEYAKVGLFVAIPELRDCEGFSQHNPYHKYDVLGHILASTVSAKSDYTVKMAVLLHDIAKPKTFTMGEDGIGHFYGHARVSYEMAIEILRRLRFKREEIECISNLVLNHDISIKPDKKSIRKMMIRLGEQFDKLIEVQKSDARGKADERRDKQLEEIELMEDVYKNIVAENDYITRKDLALNGNDIMEILNIEQSPQIREVLGDCLEVVISDLTLNTKEYLSEYVRTKYKAV